MLFSYYFDSDKTHLLNCRFRVLQFTEKAAGVIEIVFSAEMLEVQNTIIKRKEVKTGTFTFPPTSAGKTQNGFEFTRVRYGDDRKWIFTVINSIDTAQKSQIGLISDSANMNPLGMDIYNDETEYEAELKANTLAILEQEYVPPVLTQTIVNTMFEQLGYPENFDSITGSYDPIFQNYTLSDFTQVFLEPIPAHASFKISMDIAPIEMPLSGVNVFTLTIPNLGAISLLTNGLEYMLENGTSADVVRVFFPSMIQLSDFWNNGMTSKARLSIEGNGTGQVVVSYNGVTVTGIYDTSKSFNSMSFLGAIARL